MSNSTQLRANLAMHSALYQRVERSLLISREARLAFPTVFMGATGRPAGDGAAVMTFKNDATFADGTGQLDWCALCALVDAVLGAVSDMKTGPRVRPATARIDLQVTGAPAKADVSVDARFLAFSNTSRVRQSLVAASIKCGDALVGNASATCVLLDLPTGQTRAQWPWLSEDFDLAPHDAITFDARELHALKACEQAEAAASGAHPFIEHFWCGIPSASEGTASLRVSVTPHFGNRLGHVQGGLLVGMAIKVASGAAGRDTRLSNISAYVLSPATGPVLDVHAHVVRQGRNLTLVQTRITGASGKPVLEATSQHVAT